jgi:hypothetical protein
MINGADRAFAAEGGPDVAGGPDDSGAWFAPNVLAALGALLAALG